MNKEEIKILKEIQKEYLEEIRHREIEHAKEILRYRRILKIIFIIIAMFIFTWCIGYWAFGRDNNTAFINKNNGNLIQQSFNSKGDR